MKQKIAVIGAGISGLTACYKLQEQAELTLFEAGDYIGGHTATIDLSYRGRRYAIDTGFIVFNDWTYPNFIALMDELGVASQPTEMGFSLSCEESGLEYSGKSLATLFAQKRNVLRPGHWRMLRDILRFNQDAARDMQNLDRKGADPGLAGHQPNANVRLGDYLQNYGYSREFRDYYLLPMASAIWSSSLENVENMPLQFFVRFFENHGLLSVKHRPQWRVIKGGSKNYIEPMVRGFKDRVRLSCPVKAVQRKPDGVYIDSAYTHSERYDQVIFACHSDQALQLLSDPSALETSVLKAIPYSQNEVVLHTDTSLLPRDRRTWSSWNYLLGRNSHKAVLTYNMNLLQGLDSETTFCVTMNDSRSIDPENVLGRFQYAHPEFSQQGIDAQARWADVNGLNRTWFCGAWWANGFHEDGVTSALRVVDGIQCQQMEAA